jgi:Tfp pilus assembly protein PilO
VKRNELTIVLSLVVVGLIGAFWMVALGPKRDQAANLKEDVAQLQLQLTEAQQAATAGEQERRSFPVDYRKLVVLGKAVPQDGDQASLLVQLQQLADRSGVEFQSIDLADAAGLSATAAPAPSTSTTSTSTSPTETSASPSGSTAVATSDPTVDATEASAATLPIGAAVGPAGLPVMPYDLKFTGQFFQIADFLKHVDAMVHTRQGAVKVSGRLLTVDAFTLAPIQAATDSVSVVPTLTADLSVTTYLAPADQGITAGATPTGPPPATTTPASTAGSTVTSTPTSTVSGSAGATAISP